MNTEPGQRVAEVAGESRVACAWAGVVVGGLFLVAAIGKSWAPVPFAAIVNDVLRTLHLRVAPSLPIAVALIALEAFLGAAYVTFVARRAVHLITLLVLAAFVAVLCVMWVEPPRGGCGCLGFFSGRVSERAEVGLGLLRNAGLALCVVAILRERGTSMSPQPTAQGRQSERAGFTLLELLVVIAVIAVLLSLLVVALRPTRDRARRIAELAENRQVLVAVQAYGDDHAEAFPYFATPGELLGPKTLMNTTLDVPYFTGQARMYINLLVPNYLATAKPFDSDRPFGHGQASWPPELVRAKIQMTYTAFSRPRYWNDPFDPDDDSLLRPGLWPDVQFPSAKGILLDFREDSRARALARDPIRLFPWGIAWADGSGSLRDVDLTQPYATKERPSAMFAWPVLATEEGLSGRDFELRTPR